MPVTFQELTTEEQTTTKTPPTHLRVASVVLRIDTDEPAIMGAVEIGYLTEHTDRNDVVHKVFNVIGTASATLTGTTLDAVVDAKKRGDIKTAMIQAAKNQGSWNNAF